MSENTEQSQVVDNQRTTEIKFATMSNLVGVYVDSLCAVMVSGNGTSYQKKLNAAAALKEAFRFALDFGLDVTGATIRQEGTQFSKEVNSLAAVFVQAMDTRMLLMTNKIIENEQKTNEGDTNVTEQTVG
jgi:hypothetical protein